MTFRSLFWITLISGSVWACVNQYTSPGGDVESTEPEPSSRTMDEPAETTKSESETTSASSESSETPDEAKHNPTDVSGTCDDRTCVSATDCCKNYQCAFDPERSKVLRYCQPQ